MFDEGQFGFPIYQQKKGQNYKKSKFKKKWISSPKHLNSDPGIMGGTYGGKGYLSDGELMEDEEDLGEGEDDCLAQNHPYMLRKKMRNL